MYKFFNNFKKTIPATAAITATLGAAYLNFKFEENQRNAILEKNPEAKIKETFRSINGMPWLEITEVKPNEVPSLSKTF